VTKAGTLLGLAGESLAHWIERHVSGALKPYRKPGQRDPSDGAARHVDVCRQPPARPASTCPPAPGGENFLCIFKARLRGTAPPACGLGAGPGRADPKFRADTAKPSAATTSACRGPSDQDQLGNDLSSGQGIMVRREPD
jgi:hypothetical protein